MRPGVAKGPIMSITQSLSNALSGLTATARMAEVVSSNLANALTDGYVRRQVVLSQRNVGAGTGVRVAAITRAVDEGLLTDRRSAGTGLSRDSAMTEGLRRLETILGQAGDEDSLARRVSALEQSLIAASADPASDIRLGNVLTRLTGLTGAINTAERGIRGLRQDADASIADQVARLNTALGQVERLNRDIETTRHKGRDPSALLDQRQSVVDEIAGIVPVSVFARDGDGIALYTTSGQLLVDRKAVSFGFIRSPVISADMTLSGGALSGVTVNGTPLTPAGAGRLGGGSLGAAFALRDDTLVTAQTDLDALAADLVTRFQDPATDPTLTLGTPGLLTDAGADLDPLLTQGLSGRLRLNAAVDPARGGALSRLRDGMAPVTPGPVGRATQIESWLAALDAPLALGPGGVQSGAADHASDLMSRIGTARVNAERDQAYTSARWSTLREAELADGVDSDAELQMLLRIEQAYAANARVVQTVDEMIRRLLEI